MKSVVYNALFGYHAYPFDILGEQTENVREPEDMQDSNGVLVVWGGSDIQPSLYGHPQSKTCYTSPDRDRKEWALMKRAVELGIPIIGVCRGAQMLCALAGGWLFQDVENHAGMHHGLKCFNGKEMMVNSIHHQMMGGLDKVNHRLLAWASHNRSSRYVWKDDKYFQVPIDFKEPEMVYFPDIKGWAIQWHPEGMDEECEATRFIIEQFEQEEYNVTA